MFTAPLFIVTKQPKYPSTEEQMTNVVYLYKGILFVHKNTRTDRRYATWMKLETSW